MNAQKGDVQCRTMKKDRKYFVDNLTCFVTRVRNSGGVDSIRSFAISKELPPTQRSYLPPKPPPSEIPSMDSSLRGSSLSSTSFNEENNESYDAYGPATLNIDGIGSSRSSFTSQSSFEIHVSSDGLFGTNSKQSSKGSDARFKFAHVEVEVSTVQKPIVGLLLYQENLESSDKHCIGQSPNCDPGMFTSSSSFLKRLVIFHACEDFSRFYGLSLSYYLLGHLQFSHCLSLFCIITYTSDQTSCASFSSWHIVIFGPTDAVICPKILDNRIV